MKDGEMGTGRWSGLRWCVGCNKYHGQIYNCDRYPEAIRNKI